MYIDGQRILDLPIPEDRFAGGETIRSYLKTTLLALLREGHSFSGKRPLGNSDRDGVLHMALLDADLVDAGEKDEFGDYPRYREAIDYLNGLMAIAIEALCDRPVRS